MIKRFWLIALMMVMGTAGAFAADAASARMKMPTTVIFDTFKEWRTDKSVVILDAWALEPLQWIGPKDVVAKNKQGLTQDEFAAAIAKIIPAKDTRVVLYCYQSFFPTRQFAAKSKLRMTLNANGYLNVFELENMWDFGDETDPRVQPTVEEFMAREITPYQTSVPDDVKALVQRARGPKDKTINNESEVKK